MANGGKWRRKGWRAAGAGAVVGFLCLWTLAGSALAADGPIVGKGNLVAIVGDSITEQKLYSKFMETYLLACVPELELRVIQLGWSGETARGFTHRMESDLIPWKPNVVTTCYGMNDGGYRAYEDSIGTTYGENMRAIVQRLKEAGATVLVGSPGVVDSTTFRSSTPDYDVVYNDNLAKLGSLAQAIAASNSFPFADVHGDMMAAMQSAKTALGEAYHVAGGDGVHPAANGHLVMAYAFLRAMGLSGQIGTLTLDWPGTAEATGGHKIVSAAAGKLTVESSCYPFCFSGAEKDPYGTASILPFVPFQDRLNRFTLVVKNLPAAEADVVWGNGQKTFSREKLAEGINLAAEFLDNPFVEPFGRVMDAVGRKQAYETAMIKQLFAGFRWLAATFAEDPDVARTSEELRAKLVGRHGAFQTEVRDAVRPVQHTIEVRLKAPAAAGQ